MPNIPDLEWDAFFTTGAPSIAKQVPLAYHYIAQWSPCCQLITLKAVVFISVFNLFSINYLYTDMMCTIWLNILLYNRFCKNAVMIPWMYSLHALKIFFNCFLFMFPVTENGVAYIEIYGCRCAYHLRETHRDIFCRYNSGILSLVRMCCASSSFS